MHEEDQPGLDEAPATGRLTGSSAGPERAGRALPIDNLLLGRSPWKLHTDRSNWSLISMMPYMRRIPRRPASPYRMPAPWILAICPLDPKSGTASSQAFSPAGLAANAAENDRSLQDIPMLQASHPPAQPVGVRALDRTRGTAGQMSREIDVSKLLATKTSRIAGNPGKRPIFPPGDRGGNA